MTKLENLKGEVKLLKEAIGEDKIEAIEIKIRLNYIDKRLKSLDNTTISHYRYNQYESLNHEYEIREKHLKSLDITPITRGDISRYEMYLKLNEKLKRLEMHDMSDKLGNLKEVKDEII